MEEEIHMASNKEPMILCPECFKGRVVLDYARNEGQCNHCGTEFKLKGLTLKYKET